MAVVEFGLLGSIEAHVDGRLVELGRAQQRLLLAALLLDVNREVPLDELADRIWGEDHAQRGTLYGYLSRLRKALAGAGGVEIVRRPAGYVLTADPAAVDLHRFRDLAAQARAAGDDRSGGPRPAATTHSLLGYAYGQARRLTKALHHLDQAMAVFEETGDLLGQAFTHFCYHAALVFAGRDPRRGVHHAERAGRLYRALDRTAGECHAFGSACWSHALLGHRQQAIACGERAVALARSLNSPSPGAYALTMLGFALSRSGPHAKALDCHHHALALYRGYGRNTLWEAVALTSLGRTYQALGQSAEARHAWQHALDIFRAQHHTTEAEGVQRKLDSLGGACADA